MSWGFLADEELVSNWFVRNVGISFSLLLLSTPSCYDYVNLKKEVMPVHKAIGSKKDFANLDEDALLAEYNACVQNIIDNPMVRKMDSFVQHCNTSRLQHSINVSYYSFLVCYRMGWDYRSAARAGLLHDLFFYDWRTKKGLRSSHASWHPRVALDNAKKITELNKVEKDAILKHMWPCTIIPPRYIESYVLTFVDKVCAVCEVAERKYQRVRVGKVAVS